VKYAPLIEGRLVDRYKRFLADVRLDDGRIVVAHCANPGSMRHCRPDDARVWLSRSNNPKRKLEYTWELVEVEDAVVCVNTAMANRVVDEALAANVVVELDGYETVRREVRFGDRSRVDFVLERPGQRCFVEVKSATMGVGGGVTAFPDSVTERGARHLRELSTVVAEGHRGVLLFCAGRSDTKAVRPADEIDPAYGRALREARDAGVEVLAYACDIDTTGMWMRRSVPVELGPVR